MTEGADSNDRGRTVPVEPAVHVETFAGHWSLTWKADGLARFLETVRDIDAVAASATVVVDAATTPGRERVRLRDVGTEREATGYLRVEPPAPWTCSWERRTWPVVSLSGTPRPGLVRRMHRGTTDCTGWTREALEALKRMTQPVR